MIPKGPLNFRQRLLAHATNPVCASCHTHSDPIGLTLEGFDTIGQRRLTEEGKPIDLSATIQKKSFADGAGWASICTTIPNILPVLRASFMPTVRG